MAKKKTYDELLQEQYYGSMDKKASYDDLLKQYGGSSPMPREERNFIEGFNNRNNWFSDNANKIFSNYERGAYVDPKDYQQWQFRTSSQQRDLSRVQELMKAYGYDTQELGKMSDSYSNYAKRLGELDMSRYEGYKDAGDWYRNLMKQPPVQQHSPLTREWWDEGLKTPGGQSETYDELLKRQEDIKPGSELPEGTRQSARGGATDVQYSDPAQGNFIPDEVRHRDLWGAQLGGKTTSILQGLTAFEKGIHEARKGILSSGGDLERKKALIHVPGMGKYDLRTMKPEDISKAYAGEKAALEAGGGDPFLVKNIRDYFYNNTALGTKEYMVELEAKINSLHEELEQLNQQTQDFFYDTDAIMASENPEELILANERAWQRVDAVNAEISEANALRDILPIQETQLRLSEQHAILRDDPDFIARTFFKDGRGFGGDGIGDREGFVYNFVSGKGLAPDAEYNEREAYFNASEQANPELNGLDMLTPDERDTFMYLYNTRSPGEAMSYLDELKEVLLYRRATKSEEGWREYASQNGWTAALGTLKSVPLQMLNAAMTPARAVHTMLGGSPYASIYDAQRESNVYRQVGGEMMGKFMNFNIPIIDMNAGELIYGVATSMADMWAAAGISTALGAQGMVSVILGSSAASSTMYNAAISGKSPAQAVVQGLISGVIEHLTEQIAWNRLTSMSYSAQRSLLQNVAGNIALQAGTEGAEEGIANLANLALSYVMYGLEGSDIGEMMEQVKKDAIIAGETLSEQEVTTRALLRLAQDFGGEVLAGAISGAANGAGVMALPTQQRQAFFDQYRADRAQHQVDVLNKIGQYGGTQMAAPDATVPKSNTLPAPTNPLEAAVQEALGYAGQVSPELRAEIEEDLSGEVTSDKLASATAKIGRAMNGEIRAEQAAPQVVQEQSSRLEEAVAAQQEAEASSNLTAEMPQEEVRRGIDPVLQQQFADFAEKTIGPVVESLGKAEVSRKNQRAFERDGKRVTYRTAIYEGDLATVKEHQGDLSDEVFNFAAEAAYGAGLAGSKAALEASGVTQALGDRATAIYDLGKQRYDQSSGIRKARAQDIQAVAQKPGQGKLDVTFDVKQASREQKNLIRDLRKVMQVTGFEGELYMSEPDALGRITTEQGSFDKKTGKFRFDINAGLNTAQDIQAARRGAIEYALPKVMGHEFTHYLKVSAHDLYQKYQDAVIEELGDKLDDLVQQKMERSTHGDIDYIAALDEVVADGSEMMLRDSKAFENVIGSDQGLWEKFKTWFAEFFKNIQERMSAMSPSHVEAAELMETTDGIMKYKGELQSMWDTMMERSIKARAQAAQRAVDAPVTTPVKPPVEVQTKAPVTTEEKTPVEVQTKAPARQIDNNRGTVYTADNQAVGFHYALLDINDLIASNNNDMTVNPDYPAELQPRDRTRVASRDQVDRIARDLNPERLGESKDVSTGAPIVGADNVVESGNGRVMALRLAHDRKTIGKYITWLRDNAAGFGLNPADVSQNSVLVRVREDAPGIDRVDFVQKSNESTIAAYSDTEAAATDAGKMTSGMLMGAEIRNGELVLSGSNRLVSQFFDKVIPQNERAAFMDAKGNLSTRGLARIRNALFHRAYGDAGLTSQIAEVTDGSVRNVIKAMTNVSPRLAVLAEDVKMGRVTEMLPIKALVDAYNEYKNMKETDTDVVAYLKQIPMFEMVSDATKLLVEMFENNKRSSVRMTENLNAIIDTAVEYGHPDQMMMPGLETMAPSTEGIIKQGIDRAERDRAGLLAASERQYSERAPIFYSKMQREIEALKGDKFAAGSLIQQLRNKGVKADEIRWSGIQAFLQGKKSVSKDDLLGFAQGNELQIKTITKDIDPDTLDGSEENIRIDADSDDGRVRVYDDNEVFFDARRIEDDGIANYVDEVSGEEYGDDFDYVEQIANDMRDELSENVYESVGSPTKYKDYSLSGGDNYREVLFTLPVDDGEYRGKHWDEKNVFAHARLQDFRTDEGGKVLFVEEAQSDWHQDGRDRGYKRVMSADAIKELAELTEKRIQSGIDSLNEAELARYNELNKEKQIGSVPEAPFAETWHEYVMKRIIRMAAENDYDYVAWTTGQMQADRYDLSKTIDQVLFKKKSDGTYRIVAGKEGSAVNLPQKDYKSPREVTDMFGKELGNKILEAAENAEVDEATSIDVDASFGGEGMKAFYDIGGKSSQNIPRFLNKYAGQWGAKVQTIQMDKYTVPAVEVTEKMRDSVLYEGQPMYSERDSTGTVLSPQQVEYFKDSKVRDEQGRLLKVYHGTPYGGFTIFRDESYFTGNKEYADIYQNPSASSVRGRYDAADNPMTYEVYLNITRPFDTRNATEKRIFTNQFYRKYGNGTPLSERGLPDWTDSTDLIEFIQENGLDYDGIILDEGGTGGYGEEVKLRGLSYVPLEPEQIKSTTNLTPTSSPDIRYSERDTEYLAAVESGDMDTAQEMVDEAAKAAGYTIKAYHGMRHGWEFVTEPDGKKRKIVHPVKLEGNAFDLSRSQDVGIHFTSSEDVANMFAGNDVKSFYGAGGEVYSVYLNDNTRDIADIFRTSDFVSAFNEFRRTYAISKEFYDNNIEYATALTAELSDKENANQMPQEAIHLWELLRDEVEKSFHGVFEYENEYEGGGKSYAIVNMADAKSADPVTYDDAGSVIPLSQRFTDSNDIRYSERDPENALPSARAILAGAFGNVAVTDEERQQVKKYQDSVALYNRIEKSLDSLRQERTGLRIESGSQDRLEAVNAEIQKLQEKLYRADRVLINLQNSKPLRDVVNRQVDKARQTYRERAEDRIQRFRDRNLLRDERTKARDYVIRGVKAVDKLLRFETDQKHIPEGFKTAAVQFIKPFLDNTSVFSYEQLNRFKDVYNDLGEKGALADTDLAGRYDFDIAEDLKSLAETMQGRRLSDLSIDELNTLKNIVDHVKHIIRNENELFLQGKRQRLDGLGDKGIGDYRVKAKDKSIALPGAVDAVGKFLNFTNVRPLNFFNRIGSVMGDMFGDILEGQNKWAFGMKSSRAFFQDIAKKYNYNSWSKVKGDEFNYRTVRGQDIKLTREQALALYATAKREQTNKVQNASHLEIGGFVYSDAVQVTERKKGIPVKYNVNTSQNFPLNAEDVANISNWLTAEQKAYADAMVEYLSVEMGGLGNEVSMQLYGIKKYGETYYFPYKSAGNYLYSRQGEIENDSALKHRSFSKRTVVKANNPIVLNDFTATWASHVQDMLMYNALVVPLDNFNRVYNYKTRAEGQTDSMKTAIEAAYGKNANEYIKQLMVDINGGVRPDLSEQAGRKLVSLFKKGAVFASLSVTVQQPSAIMRALAMVDPKYFRKGYTKAGYNEMMKHSGVAIIKEMGRFDANMGRSSADWLTAREYEGAAAKAKAFFTDSGFRDDALSMLPQKADEMTWTVIWEAVKREQLAKGGNPGSETFLQDVAKRFNEVIEYTQVYDSVLTRSQAMRSRSLYTQMVTSFMAEPTVSYNLLRDAIVNKNNPDAKIRPSVQRAFAAFVGAVVLNALLKSFVTAGRDDDENYTYLEKYLRKLSGNIVDELNPLNLIPYGRDLVSLWQGYDVERADMSIIEEGVKAWKMAFREDVPFERKLERIAGSLAAAFGLPVKNVLRDLRGTYNVFFKSAPMSSATPGTVKFSTLEGLSFFDKSKGAYYRRLYDAIASGNATAQADVRSMLGRRGDDDKKIAAGLRKIIGTELKEERLSPKQAMEQIAEFANLDNKLGIIGAWYKEGDASREETEELLRLYWKDDPNQIFKKLLEYDADLAGEEDYSTFNLLEDSIRTGENLRQVINDFLDPKKYGYDKSDVSGEITRRFKKEYIAASTSERAALKGRLLNALVLLGYDRQKKAKDIDAWLR